MIKGDSFRERASLSGGAATLTQRETAGWRLFCKQTLKITSAAPVNGCGDRKILTDAGAQVTSAGFRITVSAAGFLLLGAASIHGPYGAGLLEASLARTAGLALSKASHDWTHLAANGRTIVLSGSAPNKVAQDAALTALAEGGVARVDHASVLVAPPNIPIDDYRFSAQWRDKSLSLAGQAPSAAARDAILAPFSSDASVVVSDDTVVVPLADKDSWIAATAAALHALSMLDAGSVTEQGRNFAVSGAVSDATTADAVEGLLAGASGAFEFGLALERSASTRNSSLPGDADLRRECQNAINRALNGRRLEFAADSAELGPSQRALLDAFAEQIRVCGDLTIEIEGHTDGTGTQAGNLALSERRSIAVRNYLVQRAAGATLAIKAYGESRPIASNRTRAGQQRNRRIDFTLVDSDSILDSQG
jgi:outer membrane protein OmpA-like peptidoglycan-associated protein